MKMKVATPADVARVDQALEMLRSAASMLRRAGAMRAYERVLPAIKSAEGARRHVRHRLQRTEQDDRVQQ